MSFLAENIIEASNWAPFKIVHGRPEKMRALNSEHGVADRLRAVAFAELQARDGFRWGVKAFPDAPEAWRSTWLEFAAMENSHAQLLLNRAEELNVDLSARTVSDSLMASFRRADRAELFYYLISTAEQRGMDVGLSMIAPMREVDAVSAAVFERCALEEEAHIAAATKALASVNLEALRLEIQNKNQLRRTEGRV